MTNPIVTEAVARDKLALLAELDGWESAYPLSAFPEPDLKKAARLLKAGSMTLDAVSASNMRHVVSCIAPKARAAILAMSEAAGPRWLPIESAPKDGARILATDPSRDYCAVVVPDGHEWGICNEHGTSLGIGFYPTHWQPLPAPPGLGDAGLSAGTHRANQEPE